MEIATESVSHLCRVAAGSADDVVQLSAWLVRDWRGTPTNAAPDKHDEIAWFDLAELPPLAHPDVRTAVVDAGGAGR